MTDIQKHKQLMKDYSKNSYLKLMRTPMQRLSYPFIVPGASYTYQLWDWDSWLTDVGIRQILKDNGDTGEGINGPGFQSWNLLVNNMMAYIEGRDAVEEF